MVARIWLFFSQRSPSFHSSWPRSAADRSRHADDLNAVRAAVTAASMSSSLPAETFAITSSSYGFIVSSVEPDLEGTKSLLMKRPNECQPHMS